MSEPLTDKQIKTILRKEYPELREEEIDRLAQTCTGEPWLVELRRKRLSKDLKTGPGPVVAADAGGVAKDDTPATSEEQYGSTSDSCFDDPDQSH